MSDFFFFFFFLTREGETIHALLKSQYKAVQLAYEENFDGRHWTLCGSRECALNILHIPPMI